MQLVSESRDLDIIWEETSSMTIKWQDRTCYRIQSGFMIFDLHLVPMRAESCCIHFCFPHGGDEDRHLPLTSPCMDSSQESGFFCRC